MAENAVPAQEPFDVRRWWPLVLVGALSLGLLASMVAGLEWKVQVAVVGLLVLLVVAALMRDKWLFFLVLVLVTLPIEVRKLLTDTIDRVMTGAPGPYFSSTDILIVIIYGLWIVRGSFIADVRRSFFSTPNLIALLVIAATLPSFVNAEAMGRGVWELTRMARAYALFFIGLNFLRHRQYVTYVIGALLAVGLVQTVIAVAQGVFRQNLGLDILAQEGRLYVRDYAGQEVVRVSGTFIEPNSFAALMALVGGVALAVALYERRLVLRLAALVTYVGVAFSIALSVSRSGMIGLAVATLLVVSLGLASRRITLQQVLVAGVGLALLAMLAYVPIRDALGAKLQDQSFEWEERQLLHEAALSMFGTYPLVGAGLNNFQIMQVPYEPPQTVLLSGVEVHSLYLLLLAEIGLVGTAALLVYAIAVYRTGVPLAWSSDAATAALAIGVIAGISGIYAADILSFALRLDVPMKMYWLLTGMLFAMSRATAVDADATRRANLAEAV